MTRAEQLRLVADAVELLDERFPDKFETTYREDLSEARDALGAEDGEDVVLAARRVRSERDFLRSQLSQATPYADEVERLHGELKKLELSREGERVFRQRAETDRDNLEVMYKDQSQELSEANRCIESLRAFPPEDAALRAALDVRPDETVLQAARRAAARGTTFAAPEIVTRVAQALDVADGDGDTIVAKARACIAELAANASAKTQLAEADYVIRKTREALQAPHGDDLAVVAERRMTSIRDLVKKADDYDKQIAEALLGKYPGHDVPTAIRKLVDAAGALAEENLRLKEKIERLGV